MNPVKNLCFTLCLLASLLSIDGASKYYTDENRPYEFGFNIDGEQHRHEKKDENGLIMGEFGFITADGVYHVTVYATDENGNFKILSMKNIRVKPYPSTPTKQGHSLKLPPSAPNAPPPPPPNVPAPRVPSSGNAIAQQPKIKIEPPANACSHCSIPTTSTQPPPQLTDLAIVSQDQQLPQQSPLYNNNANSYPQDNLENNEPNSIAQIGDRNPKKFEENVYVDQRQGFVNNAETQGFVNNGPSQEFVNNGPNQGFDNNDPSQGFVNNDPNQGFDNNYPSQGFVNNDPNQGFVNNGPNQGFVNNPNQESDNNYPDQRFKNNDPAQPNTDLQINSPNSRPNLISAQMQIVDRNTDINQLSPGETPGLPSGIGQKDMTTLLYTFNYTVGFHGHHEEGYRNGAKKGYYFITGRNGIKTRVDYTADETGFHPKISQEVLDILSDEVPKPETEKDEKYGLKGYEFKWLYYPVNEKR